MGQPVTINVTPAVIGVKPKIEDEDDEEGDTQ